MLDDIEIRLDVLREEIIDIHETNTERMPERWREHLEYQRKRLLLEYMRLRCEPAL
jgi:hypothetical protein